MYAYTKVRGTTIRLYICKVRVLCVPMGFVVLTTCKSINIINLWNIHDVMDFGEGAARAAVDLNVASEVVQPAVFDEFVINVTV